MMSVQAHKHIRNICNGIGFTRVWTRAGFENYPDPTKMKTLGYICAGREGGGGY